MSLSLFLLVYASYGFHTVTVSCRKRVVNKYTVVKKNLRLVWSIYMLIPTFPFSLLYISKYFRGESGVKENLDRMGEFRDCELKCGLGSKIKCKRCIPIENSRVNMLSSICSVST